MIGSMTEGNDSGRRIACAISRVGTAIYNLGLVSNCSPEPSRDFYTLAVVEVRCACNFLGDDIPQKRPADVDIDAERIDCALRSLAGAVGHLSLAARQADEHRSAETRLALSLLRIALKFLEGEWPRS